MNKRDRRLKKQIKRKLSRVKDPLLSWRYFFVMHYLRQQPSEVVRSILEMAGLVGGMEDNLKGRETGLTETD